VSAALDVLGIGESSLDQVAWLPHFPRFGEKLAMTDWTEHAGGQIATAVLACARLGLRTGFVGAIGDDVAGTRILAPLVEAGVELSGVRTRAGVRSRGAMILVDRASGERTVLWHRPAALALTPGDLEPHTVERARVLLLDASDPELAQWVAVEARRAGRPVVLDADTLQPGLRKLLGAVDHPIVPERLAQALFGTEELREALSGMARDGARLPVVTRGAAGAVAMVDGRLVQSPAFDVRVLDTTGAGDVFHGAFAFGRVRGLDPEDLLRLANAAAGMSCRFPGAQGGLPTRGELMDFLASRGRPIEGGGR